MLPNSRCHSGNPNTHRAQPPHPAGAGAKVAQDSSAPALRDEEGITEWQDSFSQPLRFCRGSEGLRRPQGMDPGSRRSPRASQPVH